MEATPETTNYNLRRSRPARELVGHPVYWDGHNFFVCLNERSEGAYQRLQAAKKLGRMGYDGEILGSVMMYDEKGGITVLFSSVIPTIHIEVPEGQYLVVY